MGQVVPSGMRIDPLGCQSRWVTPVPVAPGGAAPLRLQTERMHLMLPPRLPQSHVHTLALSLLLGQDLEPLALSDRECSCDLGIRERSLKVPLSFKQAF